MSTLDSLFPGLAMRVIDGFGATASLEMVAKTDDLETGKVAETVVATDVKIAPPEPFSIGFADGTLVEAGDMTTLAAAQSFVTVPVANRDRLVFDGQRWQIVTVDPIYSGDAVAAYRLQLRR